jgi:hypothetical protein
MRLLSLALPTIILLCVIMEVNACEGDVICDLLILDEELRAKELGGLVSHGVNPDQPKNIKQPKNEKEDTDENSFSVHDPVFSSFVLSY